jgi:uncharacterized membrane protein YvbJ
MPTCPNCGATVPEGAFYCGNCGTAINSSATSPSASQPQMTPQGSPIEMAARLEKAMRRTELLTYAAAGLGAAILFVIILIAFL